MTEYLTEQEQIQQIKNWVKQYGMTVLAGVALALVVTTAWHYWQDYRNKILSQASMAYDEMLTSRAQNNTESASAQAKKLLSKFPKTPYAQMAAFTLAREAVLKKNYPEAITQLNWILDKSSEHAVKEIARIRMARILIMQKKPDDALDILKKIDDKSFVGLVDEVRGDAYLAKQDNTSARQSYQVALTEIPNAETGRPILQMKYDDLATGNTQQTS